MRSSTINICVCLAAVTGCSAPGIDRNIQRWPDAVVPGWLHWRGPSQNGTSAEADLPAHWTPEPGGVNHQWAIDLPGRGTPVIAAYPEGDRVYAWGYRGETSDLVEVLVCLDARTGSTVWERSFADFISDIIYNRYSIGSPTVDGETGNVFLMTSPGLLVALDRHGKLLWQRSMMEQYGRLTFPNGRTGAPSIDGDLVIVNAISTNWGREGPARNRFYAFDKRTGDLVWSSTPGVGPPFLKDSSYCSPVFDWRGGRRVFYAGTGCGNVVCVNARTGDPLWRFQLAIGGINSSVVLHPAGKPDKLVAIHGKENIDDTGHGRMVAIRLGAEANANGQVKLGADDELWRNGLVMFTSSPTLVGDRVYQVTAHGELVSVDAGSGRILWKKKLGDDQLHASPLYADGKLFVPTWHDGFYIIKPTEQGAQILDQVKLEGACLGSPSVWNGRIYVHTTSKLYCFGTAAGTGRSVGMVRSSPRRSPGLAARLQVVPAEFVLRPGQKQPFRVRPLDSDGRVVGRAAGGVKWSKWIPPTAKVRAQLDGGFNDRGELVAGADAKRSAGALMGRAEGGEAGSISGTARGRVLPSPPLREDFESFKLALTDKADSTPFAHPPLPWIGARLKWQVREGGGSYGGGNVLAKTLNRVLFQRSMVFIGHPEDRNYTIAADVSSDGNRRGMSTVGLINQRYIIALIGNAQILEVSSNHDRVKISVPFRWKPKVWHRLKARVDVNDDGSGVVRAKAWKKAGAEPESWTIEARVPNVHRQGSPGLFGFSPQIRFAVYLDNIEVTPN